MGLAKSTAVVPAKVVARRVLWPLTVIEIARAGRAQWRVNLSRRQRRQALALLRKSHGRPSRLSRRERKQLRALVHAFGPLQFVRGSAAIVLPIPGRRKRRLLRR